MHRFFVSQEFVSPSFCPKDEVSQTHRGRGLDATKFQVGAGVVFGGTKPLVFDQKHFSFPKNSVVLWVSGFRKSFLNPTSELPNMLLPRSYHLWKDFGAMMPAFSTPRKDQRRKKLHLSKPSSMESSMNFETPTRKSLDSNLRKWKTEGSNVWPWRLLKSCCLEYQFLLISYSSSPWDSSNGWYFWNITCCLNKKIYPRRIKPWDICFGRWIYTFSSVNSCRVKKTTLWGIQTSSHSLPKICWNGWNLASEMLTTCWHPCWERLPREHTTWGHDPTEAFQFATLARSARSCSFHSPAIHQAIRQRKRPWISDPQVPASAKNHWHRTVIFRRWSWNHKYIINHLIWGSLGIKHLWSNTPIHTSPTDLRSDLNRHFLWTKNDHQTRDLMVDPGCNLLNIHEKNAMNIIEYPWIRRKFVKNDGPLAINLLKKGGKPMSHVFVALMSS